MNNRAETGIGTLLLFIVTLLIAAIAAGVMVTTSNTYSEKTLETSKDSIRESGNTLDLIEVAAKDGSDTDIEYIHLILKSGPDTASINLNNTMTSISLPNASGEYSFSPEIVCANNDTFIPDRFGITYLRRGSRFIANRLGTGDIIEICFNTPRSVKPSEGIKINIVPLKGSPIFVEMKMPDVIYKERILLYP